MTASSQSGSGAPRAKGLLGAVSGVAGFTLVSRVLGFGRWIVQATTVGAGTVAGAYATANQVPNVLYEVVVGGALAATVVPLLAAVAVPSRSRDASRIASGLLGVVLAVLTPLALLLAVLADPIAGLLPSSAGADPGLQADLVADFLRMFAAQVPLYGIGVVLTGVLQACGRFTWPALTPILSSLIVMATYAVFGAMTSDSPGQAGSTALSVLGWGTTAGVAALSLPLLYPVMRLGIRLRPTLHVDRAIAWRALRLGSAGVCGPWWPNRPPFLQSWRWRAPAGVLEPWPSTSTPRRSTCSPTLSWRCPWPLSSTPASLRPSTREAGALPGRGRTGTRLGPSSWPQPRPLWSLLLRSPVPGC